MGLFTTHHSHNKTVTNNIPYEKTVHEHRAPTDESIKIYEDILEKTKNRVLGSFKTENNVLSLLTVYFHDMEFMSSQDLHVIKYITKFKINGKEYKFEFDVDTFEARKSGNEELYIVNKIFENISSRITKSLLDGIQLKDLGINGRYSEQKLNLK